VNHNWNADRHAGKWRKRHPIWAWMPVITVLASMLAVCTYHYIEVWTPLQRFYLKTYILTGLRSVGGMASSGHYELLAVTTRSGSHWASDAEVTEAKTVSGEATVALTRQALKHGGLHLVLVTVESDDANLHEFLRQGVYQDQTLTVLLRPALWSGLGVLFLWPAGTLLQEAIRARGRRHGPRPSVPERVVRLPFHRTDAPHVTRGDLIDEKPTPAVPKHSPFIEPRLTKVKPDEPPKVMKVAVTAGDGANPKVLQDKTPAESEHKLSRRPARKERYFQ